MSLDALGWAWENSQATGAALLVLLALADHADRDGKSWPSHRRLSERTRLSPRTVRRAVDRLEALGEIKAISRPGRSSLYRLDLGQSDPGQSDPGNNSAQVTGGQGDGSIRPGTLATATADESSENLSENRDRSIRDAALEIVTQRRTAAQEAKGTKIARRNGYLARVRASVEQEHREPADSILAERPSISPEELANELEPETVHEVEWIAGSARVAEQANAQGKTPSAAPERRQVVGTQADRGLTFRMFLDLEGHERAVRYQDGVPLDCVPDYWRPMDPHAASFPPLTHDHGDAQPDEHVIQIAATDVKPARSMPRTLPGVVCGFCGSSSAKWSAGVNGYRCQAHWTLIVLPAIDRGGSQEGL